MAAFFNTFDFQPVKTYASRENAEKAVANWAKNEEFEHGRAFNLMIVEVHAPSLSKQQQVRYCPVICNVDSRFFHVVIHSGFNVIN